MTESEVWTAVGVFGTVIIGFMALTLAMMWRVVSQRFDAVDDRFEAVTQRFEAVNGRFDGLDRDVAALTCEVMGPEPSWPAQWRRPR